MGHVPMVPPLHCGGRALRPGPSAAAGCGGALPDVLGRCGRMCPGIVRHRPVQWRLWVVRVLPRPSRIRISSRNTSYTASGWFSRGVPGPPRDGTGVPLRDGRPSSCFFSLRSQRRGPAGSAPCRGDCRVHPVDAVGVETGGAGHAARNGVPAPCAEPAPGPIRGLGDQYAFARLQIWKSALRVFSENPLGVGLGQFKYYWNMMPEPVEGAILRYGKAPRTPTMSISPSFPKWAFPAPSRSWPRRRVRPSPYGGHSSARSAVRHRVGVDPGDFRRPRRGRRQLPHTGPAAYERGRLGLYRVTVGAHDDAHDPAPRPVRGSLLSCSVCSRCTRS